MSKFLVILAFLGWSGISTWYYTCELKGLCESEPTEEKTEENQNPQKNQKAVALKSYIGFQENDLVGKTGPGWDSFKDSLVKISTTDGNSLLIIGKYYSGESAPEGFRNAGLARANNIKNMLTSSISKEKMKISSEFMGERGSDFWTNCVTFNLEKETKGEAKVVESNSGLTIFFPSGSADALLSDALVNKLNRLAKEMVSTNGGANIVGHTDNQGEKVSNYKLGQKRAEMVKNLFIEKGVSPEELKASSMGETQPEGDNGTAEGRAQNRRIIITLNDSK